MSDDNRKLKIWEQGRDGKKRGDCFEFVATNFDCFESQEANLECAVDEFAVKFYHDHDGWESSWPITFHVEDVDGVFLGSVTVELEHEPTFICEVRELGAALKALSPDGGAKDG